MDRSDFGVVDGDPDIRGWDVRVSSGHKAGEVEDLIIDAQKRKVRYMIVDMADNELSLPPRRVLIPIGLAELHRDDDDVLIPGVGTEQLRALPAYDADRLDDEAERNICSALGREPKGNRGATGIEHRQQTPYTASQEADFYGYDHFNDNNLYKNRMHEERLAQARKKQENKQLDDQGKQHEEEPHANHQREHGASGNNEREHGLRLWEMRNEGSPVGERNEQKPELNEHYRMQMIRNRRLMYEERRRGPHRSDRDYRNDDNENPRHHRQDNSIAARIDREGLQDADSRPS